MDPTATAHAGTVTKPKHHDDEGSA